jgi:aminopeptidase
LALLTLKKRQTNQLGTVYLLSIIFIKVAVGVKALKQIFDVKNILVDAEEQAASEGAFLSLYKYKKEKDDADPSVKPLSESDEWAKGELYASAQNLARKWMDSKTCNNYFILAPANHLTPIKFAQSVENTFKGLKHSKVTIRNISWIEDMKMGGLQTVGKGSEEKPVFLEVHYKHPDYEGRPIVLVGKGVTFDSGGISIKPSAGMASMKGDMGGAAVVAATLYGFAKQELVGHVVALIPLCENLPSGRAAKPGDVYTAMNGKTVEVDNTDAEGRLILADALTFAQQFEPQTIIDVATLTGAMVVALGFQYSGTFTSSTELFQQLESAG